MYDNISGNVFDNDLAHKAAALDIQYVRDMRVYAYVDRSHQRGARGPLNGTKRVIVNKGDTSNPDVRARLVGREFRSGSEDSLYASTPPLEALRYLISDVATRESDIQEPTGIMISDVRRAYFHALATRDVYIELPPEDLQKKPKLLGKLRVCVYGTRGAAVNWQDALAAHFVDHGSVRGKGHLPVIFPRTEALEGFGTW